MTVKPPVPPFTHESAIQKIRGAEDAWNRQDPEQVALAYTEDSRWRNRDSFVQGRAEIIEFLRSKWSKELDYHLVKELWAVEGNRIAVRYCYESHDPAGQWWRSFGNENWEFDQDGLMHTRHSSINDVPIEEAERRLRWESGQPRPEEHPGLTELGF
jgi:nuclear transport factor 2 (NTF2) superfamily protein